MALQFSDTYRNNLLDTLETTISTAPILTIRTGAAPANCSVANSGTLLASITLPSDWMAAASGGVKSKSGTWSDSSADGTGTAGHFRIHNSAGSACHLQGTITATSGGGDMELDNTSINTGQTVTVTTFDLTAPGA